jgi:hypothetical protein
MIFWFLVSSNPEINHSNPWKRVTHDTAKWVEKAKLADTSPEQNQ